MLLARDYVAYMAREVVRGLIESESIETEAVDQITQKVRQAMADELSIEERLNEEVREILGRYAEDMRRTGASYQEMYKKVKGQLARERRLVLR
jgi:hypothetical protein